MITEEDALPKGPVSLAAAGATSPLALIDDLPPEILSYIFTLSKIYCGHDLAPLCRRTPIPFAPLPCDGFSEVSIYWRRIAIDTPALWTHIDISVGGPKSHHHEFALLYLTRSGDLPIHIHIREPKNDYDNSMGDSEVHRSMKLLAPYLSRMGTLDIESRSSSARLVESILGFLMDNGAPGSTKALSVHGSLSNSNRWITPSQMFISAHQNKSPEHFEDVLLNLRALKLQNITLHWDSMAYRCLVELQINSTTLQHLAFPISKLGAILACSPGLKILKLGSLFVNPDEWVAPTAVRLENLEVLDVIDLEHPYLVTLLPLLSLSDHAAKLSVGITIGDHADLDEEVQAFFMRSPITTLFLANDSVWTNIQRRLPALFSWLPNLECLALHQYALGGQSPPEHSLERLVPVEPKGSRRQSACEIYLIRCMVSMQALMWLIEVGSVGVLHLERCELLGEAGDHQRPRTMESAKKLLGRMYPDLECIISQKDTTAQWPCRTLLNCSLCGDLRR